MSKILGQIVDTLKAKDRVTKVFTFVHATLVESRRTGLAYNFPKRSHDETREREEIVANHGRLTEFEVGDLARYALSKYPLEASIGIAAINSAIDTPKDRIVQKNGVELVMEKAAGRRLAVVGHFPFVERARAFVKKLWVLELDPREGDLPAEKAPKVIPKADVVAITATTLVNHTLDGLLELAKGKFVVVLGPTAIMSPVLFDFGVSAVCGVRVDDPVQVLRRLSEGGSFRHLCGITQLSMIS